MIVHRLMLHAKCPNLMPLVQLYAPVPFTQCPISSKYFFPSMVHTPDNPSHTTLLIGCCPDTAATPGPSKPASVKRPTKLLLLICVLIVVYAIPAVLPRE